MNKSGENVKDCKGAKHIIIAASCPARTNWLISKNRKATNLLVGCRLKVHLRVIRIEEDDTCPKWEEVEDTAFRLA